MTTLGRREAVEKLEQAVRGMSPDYLLDFHNELFPREQTTELAPGDDGAFVRQKVLDYFRRGLEVEEIIDLWNVAFPEAWKVSYDDEADAIHYHVEPQAVRQTDR